MKISEKIERFVSTTLLPTSTISIDQLSFVGAAGSVPKLTNLFFERGISFRSEIIASEGAESFFGAESYMNAGGYIRERVFVGRYCSIGRRVTIGAGMHNMRGVSTHPRLHGSGSKEYSQADLSRLGLVGLPPGTKRVYTVIGNDVWIGDGVVIRPGVTIGTGAVIAANAVVIDDVPPFAIAGGVPAKQLKTRFPSDVVAELLETEYWEYPMEVLLGLPMRNVLQFISHMGQLEVPRMYFETYRIS
jgi:acetyltransferase-like isoleucine patch superfamily enzyme